MTAPSTGAVAQFNDLVPLGSPVVYWPGDRIGAGREGTTRSRAWWLGDHTPVVMVEGYAGAIALTHLMPVPDPAVRALIAEAVQAERGRIAAAIEWEAGGREAQALHARDEDVEFFGSKQRLTAEVKALRDAARTARDGGR